MADEGTAKDSGEDLLNLTSIMNDDQPTPDAQSDSKEPPEEKADAGAEDKTEDVETKESKDTKTETKDKAESDKGEDKATEATKGEEEDVKGEKDAETPAADISKDSDTWTKKMALDERSKRQAAEKKLADLEAKEATREAEKTEEINPTRDILDDPKGAVEDIKAEIREERRRERIVASVEDMQELHEDYDEMEAVFLGLVEENPALATQMNNNTRPGKFAYETAKKHIEVQQLTEPGYREKLKAELKLELEAEAKAEEDAGDGVETSGNSNAGPSSATKVPKLTKVASTPDSSAVTLDTLADILPPN